MEISTMIEATLNFGLSKRSKKSEKVRTLHSKPPQGTPNYKLK